MFAAVAVPVLLLKPSLGGRAHAILLGACVCAAVGLLDDRFEINPIAKFAGELVAAAIPVSAGATIDHLTLPLLHPLDLGALQYPVTMLWIVALMNSFNFIDGMDGLAAGVGTITASTFAILALSLNRGGAALLAAALAGACLGFLRHNFHPARVFMGDAGSLTLGFLLAVIAIQGVLKTAAAVALLFPTLVLLVPIFDTSFVMLHRIKYGRRPGRPTPTTCITASCASASGRDARPSRSTPGARCSPAVRSRCASCPGTRTTTSTSARRSSSRRSGWRAPRRRPGSSSSSRSSSSATCSCSAWRATTTCRRTCR